jgi:hypothetical protein
MQPSAPRPSTVIRARGALTRAPGRNLGLGRESRPPPGPKEARCPRSDHDRSIKIDGHARIAMDQKTPARRSPETLAHSLFAPPASSPFHARERERRPAARSERRHGEPPRWRARSPQGERAAVERRHCGAQICGVASYPCRVNSSRGLRPPEAEDLAGSGQGAGVPGALTADGQGKTR